MRSELRSLGKLADDPRLAIAVSGARPDRAEAEARRLMAEGCTSLVSWGIAGALDPALAAGMLLIGGSVRDGGETRPLAGDGPRLLGSELPVISAGEKARLYRETGAVAVDMETHRLARTGLPVHAIRAIADPADRALPPLVGDALDAEGRPRIGRVIAGLVRRPGDLPALLRLRRDTAAALRALSGEGRERLAELIAGG